MRVPYYLQNIEFSLDNLSPKNFLPKIEVDSIAYIDIAYLEKLGIKGLIFDVDNTLCGYRGNSVDETVKENFELLKNRFNTCIVTNTDEERRKSLEKGFGIKVVQNKKKKPSPWPYLDAMNYMKTLPKETAMIGDRYLTDVVGANKLGIHSIRVKPLYPETSPLAIKLARAFEEVWYGR